MRTGMRDRAQPEYLSQQPICIYPLNSIIWKKGKEPMELKEIVQEGLDANGYDGLFNDVGCGCYGEHLMCCGEPGIGCEAAYAFECFRCAKRDSCEKRVIDGEPSDFVCAPGKHYCNPEYQVCQNADNPTAENAAENAMKSDAQPAQTSPFALGA